MCQVRVSSKRAYKSVKKECLTRVSSKSVPEEVSSKSVCKGECLAKVSRKRVSYKSVK